MRYCVLHDGIKFHDKSVPISKAVQGCAHKEGAPGAYDKPIVQPPLDELNSNVIVPGPRLDVVMCKNCAPGNQEVTDDLKKSSSPGSGRVQKGAVNAAKMGTAACKSRTA